MKITAILFSILLAITSAEAATICGIIYRGHETPYHYLELSNGEVVAIEPRSSNKTITSLRESIISLLDIESTKYCFIGATRTRTAIQNFSAVRKQVDPNFLPKD